MGFFKSLLNVINPLPSLVKANKEADGNVGKILWNFINPAATQIRDNTGELDMKLSSEYREARQWAESTPEPLSDDLQGDYTWLYIAAGGLLLLYFIRRG